MEFIRRLIFIKIVLQAAKRFKKVVKRLKNIVIKKIVKRLKKDCDKKDCVIIEKDCDKKDCDREDCGN